MCIRDRVYYDPKTGEAKNELAESVESSDQVVWTVKLKKDAKFSDGSPIKADNYIKAWNYGANPKNCLLYTSMACTVINPSHCA